MKLGQNEGKSINWHNSKMTFKTTLAQTDNLYSTILVENPAGVGPALHLHPNGPETFFIIEGDYTFTLSGNTFQATKGDFILIPKGEPHKYKSGTKGGVMLVTTPSSVENYFIQISDKYQKGEISLEYEFECARKNGQLFLEKEGHYC